MTPTLLPPSAEELYAVYAERVSTPEPILEALNGFLVNHPNRFELLDYFTTIQLFGYVPFGQDGEGGRSWEHVTLPITQVLYDNILKEKGAKKGSFKALRLILAKHTRAHKLRVLEAVLAA